jgi:hypothetical protein
MERLAEQNQLVLHMLRMAPASLNQREEVDQMVVAQPLVIELRPDVRQLSQPNAPPPTFNEVIF